MKTLLLSLLVTLTFVSCQKLTDPVKSGNPEIVGSWTDPQYSDTLVTYNRVDDLVENQYGIKFEQGNKLVQRQNSGWCGNPPIVTTDYEGTWTWNDSTVNITVGFWGGTADLTWKVIQLTDQKLIISVVKADYHKGR